MSVKVMSADGQDVPDEVKREALADVGTEACKKMILQFASSMDHPGDKVGVAMVITTQLMAGLIKATVNDHALSSALMTLLSDEGGVIDLLAELQASAAKHEEEEG